MEVNERLVGSTVFKTVERCKSLWQVRFLSTSATLYKFTVYYKQMAQEKSLIDDIKDAPAGFKVSPGWRVGHLKEETITKSGLLVPAGSEKTSEALPLIDVDTMQQFWAVASGAWKFIWPPTGKVVLAVRESQIIAEEELSKTSENGQLPIMK